LHIVSFISAFAFVDVEKKKSLRKKTVGYTGKRPLQREGSKAREKQTEVLSSTRRKGKESKSSVSSHRPYKLSSLHPRRQTIRQLLIELRHRVIPKLGLANRTLVVLIVRFLLRRVVLLLVRVVDLQVLLVAVLNESGRKEAVDAVRTGGTGGCGGG
jgi:hypothetical protein